MGEPLTVDLSAMTRRRVEEAAAFYAKQGYVVLSGVERAITRPMRDLIADTLGAGEAEIEELLRPSTAEWDFPHEIRQRLSRIETSRELARQLVASLRPMLAALLGPLVHVSGSFHTQFKAKNAMRHAVDHGGYREQLDHMELHGAYLLHQDFAGASIPTSPSGLTLWVGLNESPDWSLRLYPGSHRRGLICDRWLANDDPRLAKLGPSIQIRAEPGKAVLFHALLVHGSCQPGPRRRASCDLRFFPLCGFLPSQPFFLHKRPLHAVASQLERSSPEVLRAPRLESQVFLGQRAEPGEIGPRSVLNWVRVIERLTQNDDAAAMRHLRRFVNQELSTGTAESYAMRLLRRPLEGGMLTTLQNRLAEAEPRSEPLAKLSALVDRLTAASEKADVANARC